MMRSAAGTTAATDDVDLAPSSTDPPGTILYPTGNSAFSASTLVCSVSTTVAGSTLAIKSLWTVSVGFRSRRQISGQSWAYSTVANWSNGTVLPFGMGTCRVRNASGDILSCSLARVTTSIRYIPSRNCVTLMPDTTADKVCASTCELT